MSKFKPITSEKNPSSAIGSQWRKISYIDSYIRVYKPSKQLISKEINCAEHDYINMSLPSCYALVM